MTRSRIWLIGVACVGMAATILAVCLLWFVVSDPVAAAQVLSRGL
jgi:hypothetical protein